jgi:hypothetical protein
LLGDKLLVPPADVGGGDDQNRIVYFELAVPTK